MTQSTEIKCETWEEKNTALCMAKDVIPKSKHSPLPAEIKRQNRH